MYVETVIVNVKAEPKHDRKTCFCELCNPVFPVLYDDEGKIAKSIYGEDANVNDEMLATRLIKQMGD